jgi:membrane protease YdiL (CAAX protease family)
MALTPETALAAAVAVLAVANLLNNRLAVPAYVATSLLTAWLLLALARLAGLTWADVGLGVEALGRGAAVGLVLAALVAVCYLVAARLPATRGLFLDRRVEHAGAGTIAYHVLVRIPLGTVVLEEVAFRGVVYGLVVQMGGVVLATAVSCALFGLWHVLPAMELVRLNRAAGRARPARVVAAAVISSALVGVVLCELRRRSGSLAPPAMVHWAGNALAYLSAFLVTRRYQARTTPS